MKKFSLEFTEEEVNYILNVLAERPFKECQAILTNIQAQASSQIQSTEPEMEVVSE